MVDKDLKECKEKFHQVLQQLKHQDAVKDDTFLEKMQSYLTLNGEQT